ncbi:MAG: hypothetical protein G01um101429_995 [Parcubacteria group bacterium Gr01-1014_29]|nr:MAG: hypothetical protein G01um101429_995 [Parcubacteria group bacterium Gr01-1014_29]
MKYDLNMHFTKSLCLKRSYFLVAILTIVFGFSAVMVMAQESEVRTSSGNLVTRVAPGELLPVSVKLVNFGGGKRVDVTIDYVILNEKGGIVLTEKETVAVETTAGFIKIIQIPRDVPPGKYTAEARITYQGQKVPAVANYQFTVERKIAGMFASQFLIYGAITVVVGIIGAAASRLIKKKLRVSRLTPHEYPEIPKEERIFYEIISDIIAQMRYRVGDKALDIARGIDDLIIDGNSGKVMSVKKSPAKIIALLILKYEKLLGQKISFAMRRPNEEAKERMAAIDKNLVVIRKYFE